MVWAHAGPFVPAPPVVYSTVKRPCPRDTNAARPVRAHTAPLPLSGPHNHASRRAPAATHGRAPRASQGFPAYGMRWATRRPAACGGVQMHVGMDDAGDHVTLHAALGEVQTRSEGFAHAYETTSVPRSARMAPRAGCTLAVSMLRTGVPDDPAARTRTDRGALGDRRLFSPPACAASLKMGEPVHNPVAHCVRVCRWRQWVSLYTRRSR